MIAILRNQGVIANPKSTTVFQAGDVIGLIGESAHIAEARRLVEGQVFEKD